jgi:hypothetical protein
LKQLDNLVRTGALKREAPSEAELQGLVRSAKARFGDAENPANSLESRFDLAYNAAHALSVAALRMKGYRSEARYVVFQCLAHTVDLPAEQWRVLSDAHRRRNTMEYEGVVEVDEAIVTSMIRVAREIERRIVR